MGAEGADPRGRGEEEGKGVKVIIADHSSDQGSSIPDSDHCILNAFRILNSIPVAGGTITRDSSSITTF